jgi:hypothetical protein
MNVQVISILLLIFTTAFFAPESYSIESSSKSQIVILGANNDEYTYIGKLEHMIYTEAFKRLKIPFKIKIYPLKRIEVSTLSGLVDGDTGRTLLYGEGRSDLIRVEEPIMYLNFNLYTADSNIRINQSSEIAEKKYTMNFPRGMKVCEKFAKESLAQNKFEDVTTTEEGIRKILSGRANLHCDLKENVMSYLPSSGLNSSDKSKIKTVFNLQSNVPIYPYLNKKHVDLAKKLNTTLKAMRAEGLLNKFQEQVEKEFRKKLEK